MSPSGTEKSGRVEIRIRNASNVDFDRVRARFPDGREVDYGAVAKGGSSAFHAVSRAYRYAGVSVKAGDREFSLNPIDYVGEKELAPGRYTYVLRLEGEQLTIDLDKAK